MGMEGRGHGRGGATNVSDGVPQGGDKGIPSRRVPGDGGDKDGDARALWRRHMRDTVIILEEGNLPHPRCENCDMLVPWRALNGRHKSTAMCKSGVERKRWRLAEADIRESTEMAFEAYGEQIESVPRFTYLWRVMTAGDDNRQAVARNLAKARRSWGRLQRILGREGATARI